VREADASSVLGGATLRLGSFAGVPRLDFGSVGLGSSAPQPRTLLLENAGDKPITVQVEKGFASGQFYFCGAADVPGGSPVEFASVTVPAHSTHPVSIGFRGAGAAPGSARDSVSFTLNGKTKVSAVVYCNVVPVRAPAAARKKRGRAHKHPFARAP
jgi:hypothetical protein